jgi:hypothetical protein
MAGYVAAIWYGDHVQLEKSEKIVHCYSNLCMIRDPDRSPESPSSLLQAIGLLVFPAHVVTAAGDNAGSKVGKYIATGLELDVL